VFYRHRPKIIFVLLVLLLLIFWLRLAYWQILQQSFLTDLFNRQSQKVNLLPVPRGQIITQDSYVLAQSQPTWLIGLNPKNCPQQTGAIIKTFVDYSQNSLTPLFRLASQSASLSSQLFNQKLIKQASQSASWQNKVAKLTSKALNPKTKWIQLGQVASDFFQQLDPSQKKCLAKIPSFSRIYPDPSMDSYFIGFVGKDSQGKDIGYFGLEGFYNQELTGTAGKLKGIYDALGNPLPQEFSFIKPPLPGRDLHLNIKYNLQHIAHQLIKQGVKKYQAQQGTIIVINPQTMQVLAITSYPTYQSSYYRWYKPTAFLNPAVGRLYEPGSTFKVFIMAAALQLKAVSPSTICTICSGPLVTAGGTIRTWNNKYHPNSSLDDIIINSDNVGMAFIASQIGKNNLYQFLVKAGFGKRTGIDLQEDQVIPLKPVSQWYPIDVLTAGFGQGISLTPIKLTQLVAAIARGGQMTNPLIAQYLTDGNQNFPVKHQPDMKLFSAKTAKLVTQMMVRAVNEGSAKWVKPTDFEVAGKTGTAQVAVEGKYDPHKTIASFVGFWPPEKPQYLIMVKLDFPKTSPWGSETAAPLFFQLAKKIQLTQP